MMQEEATYNQYLFCLVLYLFMTVLSWRWANKRRAMGLTWLLSLVFCLFSYFNADWFHYAEGLKEIDKDYKDPFYYYLAVFVGRINLLYRFFIWGGALLLFYLTVKRLGLRRNLVAYIFIIFFLPTFCYARASLAMAIYFYGLSFLVYPIKNYKFHSWLIGSVIILLSFFAHRSFLVVIALTPFIFIRFRRWHLIALLLVSPIILKFTYSLLLRMTNEMIISGDEFQSFSASAMRYSELHRLERNWKFALVTNLRNISFYILLMVILWKTNLMRNSSKMNMVMRKYLSISLALFVIATLFIFITEVGATDILAYRFLFMTGIPLCLIMGHLRQEGVITQKLLNWSMLASFVATVGFIVGKLYALS